MQVDMEHWLEKANCAQYYCQYGEVMYMIFQIKVLSIKVF